MGNLYNKVIVFFPFLGYTEEQLHKLQKLVENFVQKILQTKSSESEFQNYNEFSETEFQNYNKYLKVELEDNDEFEAKEDFEDQKPTYFEENIPRPDISKRLQCAICNKCFKYELSLSKHLQICSQNIKPEIDIKQELPENIELVHKCPKLMIREYFFRN